MPEDINADQRPPSLKLVSLMMRGGGAVHILVKEDDIPEELYTLNPQGIREFNGLSQDGTEVRVVVSAAELCGVVVKPFVPQSGIAVPQQGPMIVGPSPGAGRRPN